MVAAPPFTHYNQASMLLDIRCENIFALSIIVIALTTCPFSIKKCGKMSVFYQKTVKICWQQGATPPDPVSLRRLRVSPPDPQLCFPPLPNPGCATVVKFSKIFVHHAGGMQTLSRLRARLCFNLVINQWQRPMNNIYHFCNIVLLFGFRIQTKLWTKTSPPVKIFYFAHWSSALCFALS